MGKITKVMLGLNIAAGIAGIFFGWGVKGDLKTAEAEKNNAVTAKNDAKTGTGGLESANKQLKEELQKAGSNYATLSNSLATATGQLSQANEAKIAAEDLQQEAETSAAKLQSQLAQAEGLAQKNTELKTQIADYEALGTVEEVREWKKKSIAKPKLKGEGSGEGSKPPKPKPEPGAQAGAIASHEPKFGFYIINRGGDHGVKVGDEYNVLRTGTLVGKIKIKQVQPTVSIADAIKAFTRQKLQPGDKLVKSN